MQSIKICVNLLYIRPTSNVLILSILLPRLSTAFYNVMKNVVLQCCCLALKDVFYQQRIICFIDSYPKFLNNIILICAPIMKLSSHYNIIEIMKQFYTI